MSSTTRDLMRAAVLYGSRELRLEQIVAPKPQVGEVLLRVRRAGICGSDVHYYQHGYCGTFVPTSPFVLGHEFVANVETTGPGVDWRNAGQRVVVNPAASCGHCNACKSGRSNLCENVVMLGSASTDPPTNGAFAEYAVVPAHQCHSIPDTMEDDIAALMEPLSVVLHSIRRANGVVGSKVLVAGGGPIGLLAVLAARSLGASLVVLSEPNEERRRTALKLGADDTLDPAKDDFVDRAHAMSEGGYDVAFEASGANASVKNALQIVSRGGKIVQIGTIGSNSVSLPINDLMVRELSLLGTFRYADEFSQAIELVARGRLDLSPLVTGVFPLDEVSQAMEHACSGDGVIKVQIDVMRMA